MEQTYKNHARLDPLFHFVLTPIRLVVSLILLVHIARPLPFIIIIIAAVGVIISWFLWIFLIRSYALKNQDRIIKLEESIRYTRLTSKNLPDLTTKQIVALRFASDQELVELVDKTMKNNTSPQEIKKQIIQWKADTHRI